MEGADYLGLAHNLFNVQTVINLTPEGWAIGCFDDPFGPVLPKLRKVLQSGKFPACRIQAWWGGSAHKPIPIAKLKEKLPKYEKLARDFPGVKIFVSHSCEYDESSEAEIKKRVDLIRQLAPTCTPVNSVMKGATLPGVITERHGEIAVKPGEIVSFDGTNAYDSDATRWKQQNSAALIRFWWGFRFNLREINKPNQPVPPPSQRTAKPSPQYIQSVLRLAKPYGFAPTPEFNDEVKAIKKPDLWKSHSEDSQGHDDPRENRPVLIVSPRADGATIIDYKGAEIASMVYGGTFGNNQHRYYCRTHYGWELGQRAKELSATEFIFIRVGSRVYGPVNPAFREGYFR